MSAEQTLIGLLASYGVTGVFLFTGMALGHKGRVKAHIFTIVLFLVGFAVTLYFAEQTGRAYHFDEHAKAIHMPCAYAGTLTSLLPLVTGFRKWREKGSLFAHRVAILVFMVAFVAASATGGYMLTTRHPI